MSLFNGYSLFGNRVANVFSIFHRDQPVSPI
jgi:hypothetical protein